MNEHGHGGFEGSDAVPIAVRMAQMHEAATRVKVPVEVLDRPADTQLAEAVNDAIVETVPDAEGLEVEAMPGEPERVLDEVDRVGETLTWEHFDARAEDIANEVKRHAGSEDPEKGFNSALDAYVKQEDDPAMRKFGKLMLLAPRIYEEEKKLKVLKETSRLSKDEREQKKRSTRLVCAYNQIMSSLVPEAEEALSPRRLTGWLTDAVGDFDWSQKLIFGIQVERAGEKLVAGVPGVENSMHGDLDQDLQGQDIIFDETPSGHTSLDVKSRSLRGVMPVQMNRETGRMTLYIDPAHMDRNGWGVQEKYEAGYQKALAQVLIENKPLVATEDDEDE